MSPWNLNDNSNIYISTTKSSLASTAFFESSYWITAILKDNSFYGFSLLENQIRWLQWIVPHDDRKKSIDLLVSENWKVAQVLATLDRIVTLFCYIRLIIALRWLLYYKGHLS